MRSARTAKIVTPLGSSRLPSARVPCQPHSAQTLSPSTAERIRSARKSGTSRKIASQFPGPAPGRRTRARGERAVRCGSRRRRWRGSPLRRARSWRGAAARAPGPHRPRGSCPKLLPSSPTAVMGGAASIRRSNAVRYRPSPAQGSSSTDKRAGYTGPALPRRARDPRPTHRRECPHRGPRSPTARREGKVDSAAPPRPTGAPTQSAPVRRTRERGRRGVSTQPALRCRDGTARLRQWCCSLAGARLGLRR